MHIDRIRAWVLRAPIARPVATSFGIMLDRPAVMLELTDRDGATGLGEVWCNFPNVGAEHRARMAVHTLGGLVTSQAWHKPEAMFDHLSAASQVLALQSGEAGPFAQVIAGLDMALWDLHAKNLGQPIWRLLGGQARMQTYASGLAAQDQPQLALQSKAAGHSAFKLKVGFGLEKDQVALRALREALGETAQIMLDANQAWDVSTATQSMAALAEQAPAWIEEPLRCDAPWPDWQTLAARIATPIAAGENLRAEQFDAALASTSLRYLQPDIAKWGGFTGCLRVGRRAIEQGALLCPHWLGGGIGLKASMHLLGALNADLRNRPAMVEWDANPNPLRELMSGGLPAVKAGWIELDAQPGLGVMPQMDVLPIVLSLEHVAK
jgi:D-galactarolactone cycloisomerase